MWFAIVVLPLPMPPVSPTIIGVFLIKKSSGNAISGLIFAIDIFKKEYKKDWKNNNKEHVKETNKKYYDQNKVVKLNEEEISKYLKIIDKIKLEKLLKKEERNLNKVKINMRKADKQAAMVEL